MKKIYLPLFLSSFITISGKTQNWNLELKIDDDFNGNSINTSTWLDHAPWSNGSNSTFYATNGANYEFTGHSLKLIIKEQIIQGPALP